MRDTVAESNAAYVGREDPRYFDLKFFAAPLPGQTWYEARLEQVAAVGAAEIPGVRQCLSDTSRPRRRPANWPEGSYRSIPEGVAFSLGQEFGNYLPPKPYATDDLATGLRIMPRQKALGRKFLSLNGPFNLTWMSFDIDRDKAHLAASIADLPAPNFTAVNPANGHAHVAYLLRTPVSKHATSSTKARDYAAGVERGIRRRLGGDVRFVGLITKNP